MPPLPPPLSGDGPLLPFASCLLLAFLVVLIGFGSGTSSEIMRVCPCSVPVRALGGWAGFGSCIYRAGSETDVMCCGAVVVVV